MRQAQRPPRPDGRSRANEFAIPPMPVAWTPEVVRVLFPIPLALGRKVTFVRRLSEPVLVLKHAGERIFPSTAQGWVDLWTTIGQTTKPDAVKMAVLQVRNAMRWAEATPFRDAEAGLEAEARARLVLDGLVFLGGHDYGDRLRPGVVVDLRMTAGSILLSDVTDGSPAYSFPIQQLRDVEATDPAVMNFDGLEGGAATGTEADMGDQGTAEWMTDHFGKSAIRAVVRIATETSELYMRSLTMAPDAAQIALSPIRRRLARDRVVETSEPDTIRTVTTNRARASSHDAAPAPVPDSLRRPPSPSRAAGPGPVHDDAALPAARRAAGPDPDPADPGEDFVSHLERLARLRDSGALSEYEYLVAKTKLLS